MRGKPLRPMQGEVSPSDPLLRLSGAVQPTAAIMRHAKQFAPDRLCKTSIQTHRSGAGFCSEGRRITWLTGAAQMPRSFRRNAGYNIKRRTVGADLIRDSNRP